MQSYIDRDTGKNIVLDDVLKTKTKTFSRREIEADITGKAYYDFTVASGYNPFCIGNYQLDWAEWLYRTYDLKDKKVLELGSGANTILASMKYLHPDVDYWAIEPSPYMSNRIGEYINYLVGNRELSKILKEIKPHLKQRVQQKLIHDCDCYENQFDFVWSSMVFEHIHPNYLEKSLEKLSKILKPNGILLIMTTDRDYSHPTHILIEEEDWWVKQGEKHGFKSVSDKYIPKMKLESKRLPYKHDFYEMHRNDTWLVMVWENGKTSKQKEIYSRINKSRSK